MRLRTHFILLVAATLLPLLALTALVVVLGSRAERAARERTVQDTSRALASAVERELGSSVAALRTLGTSTTLDEGNYRSFYSAARRAREENRQWLTVYLLEASGFQVFTLLRPLGTELPRADDYIAGIRAADGRPYVTDVAIGPVSQLPVITINVPISRGGELRYVLGASIATRTLAELLAQQTKGTDAIAAIRDRKTKIVARSHDHDLYVGREASAELRRALEKGSRDIVEFTSFDGHRVDAGFSRVPLADFTVAVAVPALRPMSARLLILLGGGIVVVGIALVTSLILARRVAAPIHALAKTASALSVTPDVVVPMTPSSIPEIDNVQNALQQAAAALRNEMVERERRVAAEAAREEASAASRAKDDFLAMLSHELRTPLNAVYGWARMLQSGQLAPRAAERALDAIVRNSEAQTRMIEDLLDISRVIAGKMRLQVQAVHLKHVIAQAVETVRPAANAKAIRLQTVLVPHAESIIGDPARLQQVVWNLLANAVKFTPTGGRVEVHLRRVKSDVQIIVSDTGRGIHPHVLPFIFDRFRQGDSSSTRAHGGLGLGLALVRYLVELHGGTVVAQSDGEGKGAIFTVTLPIAKAASTEPVGMHDGARVIRSSSPPRLDGVRILVVEDDAESLDLVTAILATAGADVSACRSAAEALASFMRSRPDVLVSDIEMPNEDGYSLIRKIREIEEQGEATPAVALTAYGAIHDRMHSLAAGYNMHVAKPVDPQELIAIIASLAQRYQGTTT